MEKPLSLETTPSAKQWAIIGDRQHHGICLPLFALHSKTSAGIGEYTDLIPMITWCNHVGFDVLQLLPLNDTGPDTSPYGALSAFALNPINLGLASLPYIDKSNTALISLLKEAQVLTSRQRIDYPQLHSVRQKFLREYFRLFGVDITNSADFRQFIESNKWLDGYALFKSIKECYHWQSWTQWPEDIKNPDSETLQDLHSKYDVDIAYHQTIQFLCFQQMAAAKKHAESLGVFLKGDIPILINRESADVWLHRDLFNLNLSAGAPADHYADEGQNWGVPLYNWDAMEQQDYAWWNERLKVAKNFYHIYRLDHVVGFYRIWAIAPGQKAKEGHFVPAERSTWIDHGEKILRNLLDVSLLLPIAEDLGTIPPEVRLHLAHLGICGTKVMRWERFWETDKHFLRPNEYPVLSMTTVSTHDSTPLSLWWTASPEESKAYAAQREWDYHPILPPDQHFAILYDSHHTNSLFHINLLGEYLAMFPELVWQKPEDERINTPGIVSDKNWTYRFRPSIETIIDHAPLYFLLQDLKNA
jgi:4-alpha-glucanotransferase